MKHEDTCQACKNNAGHEGNTLYKIVTSKLWYLAAALVLIGWFMFGRADAQETAEAELSETHEIEVRKAKEAEQATLERQMKELVLVNIKLSDPAGLSLSEVQRLQNKQLTLLNIIHLHETPDKEEGKGLEAFLKEYCSEDLHNMATELRRIGDSNKIIPEIIVAIAWADSRCGRQLTTAYNYGNVGNTDGGRRQAYSSIEGGLEAIAQTLNNRYLGQIITIGGLSRGGGGTGAVYATSPVNWNYNVKWALSEMLGQPVDESFKFRTI